MSSSKYVIVKNHVRELPEKYNLNNTSENENSSSDTCEKSPIDTTKIDPIDTAKKKRSTSCEEQVTKETRGPETKQARIDNADLQELKTVYNQIKVILAKIECKYSHLLEIDEASETQSYATCSCYLNQKSVFNEDGSRTTSRNKTCFKCFSKKIRLRQDSPGDKLGDNKQELPDEINSLLNILRDPYITVTYRNKVINKLKRLKQEQANEIKFYKQYLKDKAASDTDGLIRFDGSNLSSISGYT